MAPEVIEQAAAVLGDRARRDVPLGPLTTYRVGGPAALFLEIGGVGDLDLVRRAVRASGVSVLVVGRGSNLLVADAGFRGLALVLGDGLDFVDLEGGRVAPEPEAEPEPGVRIVRAGAATALPVLARRTAAAALTGLEWAVGVPGSVGGGVRMNAGGHGADIGATLVSARVYDLHADAEPEREMAAEDLDLSYRHSSLGPGQVVTAATFWLRPGERSETEGRIAEIVRWRREHQPGGPNAGSVFTNPPGDAAGRLVEAAGLKGHRRGSAWVSSKHSNFFQVDEGGSADDVRALMEEVARIVHARTGVQLRAEVHQVGFQL